MRRRARYRHRNKLKSWRSTSGGTGLGGFASNAECELHHPRNLRARRTRFASPERAIKLAATSKPKSTLELEVALSLHVESPGRSRAQISSDKSLHDPCAGPSCGTYTGLRVIAKHCFRSRGAHLPNNMSYLGSLFLFRVGFSRRRRSLPAAARSHRDWSPLPFIALLRGFGALILEVLQNRSMVEGLRQTKKSEATKNGKKKKGRLTALCQSMASVRAASRP